MGVSFTPSLLAPKHPSSARPAGPWTPSLISLPRPCGHQPDHSSPPLLKSHQWLPRTMRPSAEPATSRRWSLPHPSLMPNPPLPEPPTALTLLPGHPAPAPRDPPAQKFMGSWDRTPATLGLSRSELSQQPAK